MLKIALVIIFCPLIIWGAIWGIKKIISPVAGTMRWITPFVYLRGWISSKLPTKKKIIFFVVIGVFVFVYYPKIKLWFKFKVVERAQLAKEIEPLEKQLDGLLAKATDKSGKGLSNEEAEEMQSLKKEIEAAEKKVKGGPPISAKHEKEVEWVMELYSTDALMNRECEQDGSIKRKITSISFNDLLVELHYIDGDGKLQYTKLTRDDPGAEYYLGYVKNTHPKAKRSQVIIRLLPDKEAPYWLINPVNGETTMVYPLFEGWLGNSEVEIKITKRTSLN